MLTPPLTDVEVRILGALAEKAVTTPDNYPLSLSALAAACNQTTSRDPIMRLEESDIAESIVTLRRRSLLRAIQPAGSRVTKYAHLLNETLDLDAREIAVESVLMLRGAQTSGELYARTTRLADFSDVAALEMTLEALVTREAGSLATRMPRRAGQKEQRYAHTLSGDPTVPGETASHSDAGLPATGTVVLLDRVALLERMVEELREALATLQAQFAEFRAEFQ